MKNNIDIEDWYKNELSNYEVKPDEKGWDAIADKLDHTNEPSSVTEENIEGWYKNEINNFEATPDQQVWNKLSTKLDVQNVWTRVYSSLNRYDRIIWWRNFTLRAAALLTLLFGSYLTYNSYNNKFESSKTAVSASIIQTKSATISSLVKQKTTSSTIQLISSVSRTIQPKSSISSSILANNKKTFTPISKNLINPTVNSTTITDIKETPVYASLTMDKYTSKKTGSLSNIFQQSTIYSFEKQGVNFDTKTLELKEFLVKKEKNKIIFNDKRFSSHFIFGMYAKRFYVGINAGFKKQNLLTKVNSNHQISTAKQNQYLDFGYNFGGTLGLIMSDKLNLESNVNFISTSGYNRKYYSNDFTFTDELNLNYTTVSVLAKRMSNKSTFDDKKYSTNLFGGIYGGYLTSAEVVSGEKTYQVANQFKNLDFGLVLGIEQDRYLSKQLIITPGIRYTQGIINIVNEKNPYEAARTFAVEFNIGMKYIFLKKNK